MRWHCLEHHYNGDDLNTDVEYRLLPEGSRCRVEFAHSGWKAEDETFKLCTKGWKHFICTSLKNLVETGKGEPHVVSADKIRAQAKAV